MTKNFATGTQRKLVIQVARYCYAPAAEFMKSFMEKYPDVDIKISTYNPSGENDINGELMSENTDIFFVFNDNIPASASASVSLRKVVDGEICVAVGKEHRLAEKKHITLADLQGECILGSGFMDIGLTRALSNAMTSQGYKPYKSKHTDGEEGRSMRVVTGAGVALVPDISDYDACWGVKKIPLSDFQFSKDMYMVWSSTNTNPTLNLFLKETSFITK